MLTRVEQAFQACIDAAIQPLASASEGFNAGVDTGRPSAAKAVPYYAAINAGLEALLHPAAGRGAKFTKALPHPLPSVL